MSRVNPFAPPHAGQWSADDVTALCALLKGQRVVALAGAGCSTESGIPDYRSPAALAKPRTPMTYQRFLSSDAGRARYWARSALGWPRMQDARPNAAHHALARLEHAGVIDDLITQNVDGLHHAAGNRRVLELHGALRRVRCLECNTREDRAVMQTRLMALNPFLQEHQPTLAPDGDTDFDDERVSLLKIPGCLACGGMLKPDVVFFGESVPPQTVSAAWEKVAAAQVLLVVGSSLTVFSGFRFARYAAEHNQPLAIINLGPTRADALCKLKIEARLGDYLPALCEALQVA